MSTMGCEKEENPYKQRLLVVANRLPVSAVRMGDDNWKLNISAGGLVSSLLGEYQNRWLIEIEIEIEIEICEFTLSVCTGLKGFEVKWIGWAGVSVTDEVGQKSLTKSLAKEVLFIISLNLIVHFVKICFISLSNSC